jgi:hypothetical protein
LAELHPGDVMMTYVKKLTFNALHRRAIKLGFFLVGYPGAYEIREPYSGPRAKSRLIFRAATFEKIAAWLAERETQRMVDKSLRSARQTQT